MPKSTQTERMLSMDNHTRKLLGLEDQNIVFDENWLEERKVKNRTAHIIYGKLTYEPKCCEKCGIKNTGQIIKNGTHKTRIQLPKFNQFLTFLELKRTRFLCHECGATFNAKTPIVEEHDHLSKALKYQIALDLKNNISRKQISENHFVSDVSIRRIMDRLMETFKPNLKDLPEVLCFDEFRSTKSCEGSMSFICVDAHTKKIIEILEDRRIAKLIPHFRRYEKKAREKVKYVVMDMNAPYEQLVHKVFPNAEIVIDRFHIVQHINRAFNQIRVQVMNSFKNNKDDKEEKKKYSRLKRYWKLLLKDSSELDCTHYHYNYTFRRPMTQQGIIDELLSYNDTLKLTYQTMQLLRYHYTQRDSFSFFQMIDEPDPNLPDEFVGKFESLKKYRQGIENAFSTSYSNGLVEGTNNKIKVIKRVAYGYRNFRNFRNRIYIVQGLIFN